MNQIEKGTGTERRQMIRGLSFFNNEGDHRVNYTASVSKMNRRIDLDAGVRGLASHLRILCESQAANGVQGITRVEVKEGY